MSYDYESQWEPMKALAEAGRYDELLKAFEQVPDLKTRVALYRFIIRGLMFREWNSKSFVPVIRLGDAAVAAALENFRQHPDDLTLKDEANIICYNMSSNLAGCWDNGFTKEPEHFRKGLEYALRALEFRKELKKGPRPFSLAFWAKGAHEFFLGDFMAAEASFRASLKHAEELAREKALPVTVSNGAPFEVVLPWGYIALAQFAQGRAEGRRLYDEVLAAFEAMRDGADSEDVKADAEIGLDQLRYTFRMSGF